MQAAPSPSYKVMLVDDEPDRAEWVREFLSKAGMEVSTAPAGRTLLKHISDVTPDIILIDIESPDRDMLESLSVLSAHQPTPIVMFSEKRGTEFINAAIAAGVTAYMVGEIEPTKVKPIIDAAMAQFQAFQGVRKALDDSQEQLRERRNIEKAKLLLIQQHGMNEERAHQFLRDQAMQRRLSLGAMATTIIKKLEAADRTGVAKNE
jgi:response regulator NasT